VSVKKKKICRVKEGCLGPSGFQQTQKFSAEKRKIDRRVERPRERTAEVMTLGIREGGRKRGGGEAETRQNSVRVQTGENRGVVRRREEGKKKVKEKGGQTQLKMSASIIKDTRPTARKSEEKIGELIRRKRTSAH